MERREYFRVRAYARFWLSVVTEEELDEARVRVVARHSTIGFLPGSVEESRLSPAQRITIDLLKQIALTLDRIDRRYDERNVRVTTEARWCTDSAIDITISGSGFSTEIDMDIPEGTWLEIELDMLDSGIPRIPALARVVGRHEENGSNVTAIAFEEIHRDDLERIIQLTIRNQRQSLREVRREQSL